MVYPRPERELPVWIGVGGNPQSVARAGLLGLPLVIAIIGGEPARFAPLADLYRRALEQGGHPPLPIAVHAHGYIADSEEKAITDFYPSYAAGMTKTGRERGWGPMTREKFDVLRGPEGSLLVGTPEQVAGKITAMESTLGIDRFMLHISVGTMPHDKVLSSIEMLGNEVAPLVG